MNITDLIIPPWVKIAVPLAILASVIGGFWALDHSRDYWKADDQKHMQRIVELNQQISDMTTRQDVQHGISEKTVTKVVQGPERIKTIVQHIHDAPEGPDCTTPDLELLRNTI
jgi:hypothetical protein